MRTNLTVLQIVQLTPAIRFTLRIRTGTQLNCAWWEGITGGSMSVTLHTDCMHADWDSIFRVDFVAPMLYSRWWVQVLMSGASWINREWGLCCEENAFSWQPTGIKGGTGLIDILLKTQMGHRQACRPSIKSLCESCRICSLSSILLYQGEQDFSWHYHTAKWKCFGKLMIHHLIGTA